MSTSLKKVIAIFAVLFLVGCGDKTVPITSIFDKPPMDVSTEHVKMTPIKWRVIELDGKLWFALDAENYTYLSTNMEEIQAKLVELQTKLDLQHKYYNSN